MCTNNCERTIDDDDDDVPLERKSDYKYIVLSPLRSFLSGCTSCHQPPVSFSRLLWGILNPIPPLLLPPSDEEKKFRCVRRLFSCLHAFVSPRLLALLVSHAHSFASVHLCCMSQERWNVLRPTPPPSATITITNDLPSVFFLPSMSINERTSRPSCRQIGIFFNGRTYGRSS